MNRYFSGSQNLIRFTHDDRLYRSIGNLIIKNHYISAKRQKPLAKRLIPILFLFIFFFYNYHTKILIGDI